MTTTLSPGTTIIVFNFVTISELSVTFITEDPIVFSENLCYIIIEKREYQRKPLTGDVPDRK